MFSKGRSKGWRHHFSYERPHRGLFTALNFHRAAACHYGPIHLVGSGFPERWLATPSSLTPLQPFDYPVVNAMNRGGQVLVCSTVADDDIAIREWARIGIGHLR